MDKESLLCELRRLTELVEDWGDDANIPLVERDLALDQVRRIYEYLRFSNTSVASVEPVAVPLSFGLVDLISPEKFSLESETTYSESVATAEREQPIEVRNVADPVDDDRADAIETSEQTIETESAISSTEEMMLSESVVVDSPDLEPESIPQSAAENALMEEQSVGQNLFGIAEETVRHRRRQRVIMSLYDATSVSTPTTTSAAVETKSEPSEEREVMGQQGDESPDSACVETSSEAMNSQDIKLIASSDGPVLGEVINREVQCLSDTIQPVPNVASELRYQEAEIDLRRAIGINDQFLLIRDLFGGDAQAYEKTIEYLNAFDNLDDCMIFIIDHFAWNPNSDGAKLLMELLERKFA